MAQANPVPTPAGGLPAWLVSIISMLVVGVLMAGGTTVVQTSSRVSVLEAQMGNIEGGIQRIEKRMDREEHIAHKEQP